MLGLIPARAGSKRLLGKNLLCLLDRPLIAWSIDAGKESTIIDNVVVSTEDKEIIQVAKKFGADSIIERPFELATDHASSNDVLIHALDTLSDRGESYSYVAFLQPTSPLRTAYHIDEVFKLMATKRAGAVIGVCKTEHPREWTGKIPSNGSLSSFFLETELGRLSQEFSPTYQINGAIYIVPTDKFLQENTLFLQAGMVAYVMDRFSSVDIDEEYDLMFADWLLTHRDGHAINVSGPRIQ